MTESEQIALWAKWEADFQAKVPAGAPIAAVQDAVYEYWDTLTGALTRRSDLSLFDSQAFASGVFDIAYDIRDSSYSYEYNRAPYVAGRRAGERLLKRVKRDAGG